MRLEIRPEGRTVPKWLVTYGDMMSLLLVLFAYLFSLKTLQPQRNVTLTPEGERPGLPLVFEPRFEPGVARLKEGDSSIIEQIGRDAARERSTITVTGYYSPDVGYHLTKKRISTVTDLLRGAMDTGAESSVLSQIRPADGPGDGGGGGNPLARLEICLLTSKLGREIGTR